MNCCIYMAYLNKKNKCPGCRIMVNKLVTRVICKIKIRETLTKNEFTFCFECGHFPCKCLKYLDKRYRTRYSMSIFPYVILYAFTKKFFLETGGITSSGFLENMATAGFLNCNSELPFPFFRGSYN